MGSDKSEQGTGIAGNSVMASIKRSVVERTKKNILSALPAMLSQADALAALTFAVDEGLITEEEDIRVVSSAIQEFYSSGPESAATASAVSTEPARYELRVTATVFGPELTLFENGKGLAGAGPLCTPEELTEWVADWAKVYNIPATTVEQMKATFLATNKLFEEPAPNPADLPFVPNLDTDD